MKRFLALLLCLTLTLSLIPAAAAEDFQIVKVDEAEDDLITVVEPETRVEAIASGAVSISTTTFPDTNFRSYVATNFDTDENGVLSSAEINAVTKMNCKYLSIRSLSGIEIFKNLKSLSCDNNQLTSIDMSGNPLLEVLSCTFNKLEEINVADNPQLSELYCGANGLTSLDITNNSNLTRLACERNKITSINTLNNSELVHLSSSNCPITSLDLSKNKKLNELYVDANALSSLDISGNTELSCLVCYGNSISTLYIGACPNLVTVFTTGNRSEGSCFGPDMVEYQKVTYSHNDYPSLYLCVNPLITVTTTLIDPPVITTQPKSVIAAADSAVEFTVAATGGALSYQWQYRTSSGSWKNSGLTGNKTATLSVKATEARNGLRYRCKITNAAGTTNSNAAKLTVCTKPTVTTQPTSQSAAADTTVQFTVAATGGALSYQWQYRTSSSGSWKNSGSTGNKTATLTLTATEARSGYQFRCKITNLAGTSYTKTVTLTVK